MTRFLELLIFSLRAKKMGNRNFSSSKLGKELETELNTTDPIEIKLTPGILNPDGAPQEPPKRYEDEFLFNK